MKKIVSKEYQNRKGPGLKTKKIIRNNDYNRNDVVKEVKWNFYKNEVVYIKSGYAERLVGKSRNSNTAIDILDAYVLIVGDKEYKTYRSKRNCFFILYKDTVYTIEGKFLKSID